MPNHTMKVVSLSQYDDQGGAAIAAYRLHDGLRRLGVDSHMLVQFKGGSDPDVVAPDTLLRKILAPARPVLDRLLLRPYDVQVPFHFHASWIPGRIHRPLERMGADIVNLHGITGGFVSIEDLAQIQQPIVWTLHDMWPFTGGCHYAGDCRRFIEACGSCPMLDSQHSWDLSRITWYRKKRAWRDVSMHLVSPSRWISDLAQQSSLFSGATAHVIPNGLDLSVFRPVPRETARHALDLPLDREIVLFGAVGGAANPFKGFAELATALRHLAKTRDPERFALVVFGTDDIESIPDVPCLRIAAGRIGDSRMMALLYAAADVMVVPSRQDNLPQTGTEPLACGTPVVAFDVTGISDLIQHRKTGYLAQAFDAEDLAAGIRWILDLSDDGRTRIRQEVRQLAEQRLDVVIQARKYAELYQKILDSRT